MDEVQIAYKDFHKTTIINCNKKLSHCKQTSPLATKKINAINLSEMRIVEN